MQICNWSRHCKKVCAQRTQKADEQIVCNEFKDVKYKFVSDELIKEFEKKLPYVKWHFNMLGGSAYYEAKDYYSDVLELAKLIGREKDFWRTRDENA